MSPSSSCSSPSCPQYLNGTIRHTDCGLAIPYHWGGMTHGPNVATLGMCYAKARSCASDLCAPLCRLLSALLSSTRRGSLVCNCPHFCCAAAAAALQAPKVDAAYAARLFNYGKHQARPWTARAAGTGALWQAVADTGWSGLHWGNAALQTPSRNHPHTHHLSPA